MCRTTAKNGQRTPSIFAKRIAQCSCRNMLAFVCFVVTVAAVAEAQCTDDDDVLSSFVGQEQTVKHLQDIQTELGQLTVISTELQRLRRGVDVLKNNTCLEPTGNAADCAVTIQSVSYGELCKSTNRGGFVELNRQLAWFSGQCDVSSKPNGIRRGVSTMILDPYHCDVTDVQRFDTHDDSQQSASVGEYLYNITDGTYLIGVTVDEPAQNLSPAQQALLSVGVNVTDVVPRGNFAFLIRKGHPLKTKMVKSLSGVPEKSTLSANFYIKW